MITRRVEIFNMKVILLKDIPKLGKKYEVKKVKNGYGRNFLLPRKLAEMATKAILKNLDARIKSEENRKIKIAEKLSWILEKFKGKEIAIKEKANEKGELFGSVSQKTIADKLKEEGFDIPEECVELKENIKHVGDYEIKIKINGKEANFKLKITDE